MSNSKRRKTRGRSFLSWRPRTPIVIGGLSLLAGVLFVGGGYLIGARRSAGGHMSKWAVPVYLASRGAARLTSTESGKDGLTKLHLISTDTGKRFDAWGLPGKAHLVMLVGDVFNAKGQDVTPHPQRPGLTTARSTSTTRGPRKTASITPIPPAVPSPNGGDSSLHLHASVATAGSTANSAAALRQAANLLWGGIPATHGFVTRGGVASKTRPVLQVFFDANCPFCHQLYLRLSNLRGVSIRWIPVAILKKSSLGRGAAILAGGAKALAADERGFDEASETGGIAEASNKAEQRLVAVNTMVLASASNPVYVPAIVWRTRDGVHHVRLGVPDTHELTSILNQALPEGGRG